MKIALVTDQHFGVRGDSLEFVEYYRRFYSEVCIPYLLEHNITTVIDLGDTFDRRKYVNLMTLKAARDMWFGELEKHNIVLHTLVGNHTMYYRNTSEVNTLDLLLNSYKNITVYKEPSVTSFDGCDILMMPWIHSGNREKCFDIIANTSAQVLFGHLEIQGIEMHRGMVSHDGYDKSPFDKFDVVASGHYHTKTTTGNIHYLGTAYEMTWIDYDDPKGFHIFDTETREFTRVPNPLKMFHKVWYDDENMALDEVIARDFTNLKDSYVKVIIQNKTNPYWFDLWLGKIYEAKPIEVTIVEDHKNMDTLSDDDIINNAEDTLTILTNYVKVVESKVNKNDLDNLMRSLYNEAINMETDTV